MVTLTPPPAYTDAPTGPMCRLLRRLFRGAVLTAVRTGPGRVLCQCDGHECDRRMVAGLLARGLVEERATADDLSGYVLTAAGRRWASDVGGE